MKWSKNDIEKFKACSPKVNVDSVEGNILLYSYGKWKFKARLLKGGTQLSWTVHFQDDNQDLFL